MTPPNPISHFEQKLVVACFLLPSGNSGLTLLCRCSLQSKIGLRLAKCCNFTGQSCRLGATMRRARGCTASKRSPLVLALHSCAQLWFHGCPLYKFRLRAAWRAAQSSRWKPKWCHVQTMHVPSNEGMKRCRQYPWFLVPETDASEIYWFLRVLLWPSDVLAIADRQRIFPDWISGAQQNV